MNTIENALEWLAVMKSTPAWQLRAEARIAKRMAGVFDKAAAAALRQLAARGLGGGEINSALILKPIVDAEQLLLDIVADGAVEAAEHARNSVIDNLRKKGVDISKPPPLAVPSAQKATPFSLLEEVKQRIKNHVFQSARPVFNRLGVEIMSRLADAYYDGLGIDDAADQLKDLFVNIRDYELKRVARTEIHGAQSDQTERTMQEFGTDYEQWITAMDGRERDSHADIHEQITRVGEPFSNGLQYPGDRGGPIEEWVNCRCRSVPFIMSPGQQPPPGASWFWESEIINTEKKA